ncbi:MAG: 30S ribosomal protein S7 [Planctomycetes bacterium]|nr:30S ribosomal protein S7 [Planctomycetota bacterium]
MAGKYFQSFEHLLRADPTYPQSQNVSKFVNCIMREGKRSLAQGIVYRAFGLIKAKVGDKDPIEVFEAAVENVKPVVEVRSKRVGGANYQVPVEVNRKRQRALAFRWILEAAREKKGKPLHRTLAEELLAAFNREGGAMAKRDNTHKMAEANKAFAHFAW